ncbi:MAG: hypothetical protein DIU61_007255 [Bacteroidota bacterium]|jgi:hypothetical protein|nr:MAG: hypothetical protein DIU61_08630 [Bacteroidota bacterium]
MRYLALLVILVATLPAQAQDDQQPARYYNRTSTGILVGGEPRYLTGGVTTIHGISVGPLAMGIGVGIEGYQRWRTVPIFGSLSYHPGDTRESGPFIQLNMGHTNCKFLPEQESIRVDGRDWGFMFSTLAGYQIAAGKLLVNFSAGYQKQKLRAKYSAGLAFVSYTLEEEADRFVFKIGVGM